MFVNRPTRLLPAGARPKTTGPVLLVISAPCIRTLSRQTILTTGQASNLKLIHSVPRWRTCTPLRSMYMLQRNADIPKTFWTAGSSNSRPDDIATSSTFELRTLSRRGRRMVHVLSWPALAAVSFLSHAAPWPLPGCACSSCTCTPFPITCTRCWSRRLCACSCILLLLAPLPPGSKCFAVLRSRFRLKHILSVLVSALVLFFSFYFQEFVLAKIVFQSSSSSC